MTGFAERIAVVTGAGSGIGREIAVALAAEGASVWLIGRTLETLEETADAARKAGGRATCCACDVSDEAALRGFTKKLGAEAGTVDVLVHNAGVITVGSVTSASVEEFDRQYQVNLRAPYALTQAILPRMRAPGGQIVFINSSAAFTAPANVSQYSATKAGLKAFADSLRAEVNGNGIRVLSIYPGRTATPLQAAVHEAEGKVYHPDALAQPADVAAAVMAALKLPFTAEITDIKIRSMRKP